MPKPGGYERTAGILMPLLDAAIIALLPDEGSTMAGIYPLAKQVKEVRKELIRNAGDDTAEDVITSDMLASRVRILKRHGYVVDVVVLPVSSGMGWQRTEAGKKYAVENGANVTPGKR